jgi:hypothetical protein
VILILAYAAAALATAPRRSTPRGERALRDLRALVGTRKARLPLRPSPNPESLLLLGAVAGVAERRPQRRDGGGGHGCGAACGVGAACGSGASCGGGGGGCGGGGGGGGCGGCGS